MALIGMRDVSVGYGGLPLLEHVNIQIEAGERICLLGRNGVGKSTFMRLIAGGIAPESGEIIKSPQLTITSLSQDVPSGMSGELFDVVAQGLGERGMLLSQYHHVTHLLAGDHENKSLMTQLDKLQHELDRQNAWETNRLVEIIIERLELDADAETASLSAGMKRRVLLAQAIVREPDVLLLDEPTNHLDIEAVEWIEEFLETYKGTLISVSHDRTFVKKLATSIIELDRGKAAIYACGYETFLVRKEIANEAQAAEAARFDKKLAQEEVWIRKGIKARRTRNEGRVRALEKMRVERSRRREAIGSAKIQVQDVVKSGMLVIEAKNVSFAYEGSKEIVSNFSTMIMRGDKIGIIGPNGAGKTTLLRVLLKELEAGQGLVRHGTNLEIAYFDQLHKQLDYQKSVFENVADGNETVVINGMPRHIMGYLQDFLFTPNQSRSPVANLSGGERNRLLLARLFTRPSNVLVLDEPTNDLDIETLDLLEECLANYPGTVLMVSHDREFLNNVVTGIMVMEGGGVVKEYVGGYDDYLRQRKVEEKPAPQKTAAKVVKAEPVKEQARRLTFKEKKELEALPAMIEKLESELAQLHETMADPAFYKKGADVAAVTGRAGALKMQLDKAYARWEELI